MSADFVINTSRLTLARLQKEIYQHFADEPENRTLSVTVMSFGFKFGIPMEADMVLDTRFLPNPYYVAGLREKTGLDREVFDFVMEQEATGEFLERLRGLVEFLLPQFIEEGKSSLTVAVGCTGGRHRSVAVACALSDMIQSMGQSAETVHRDVDKQ